MTEVARKNRAHPTPPLAVGERWRVKLPGEITVSLVEVDDMTPHTFVLRTKADLGRTASVAARYERGDVKFVERVGRVG